MTIRTIHENEAEEFLKLLCEVFDLDFHRARGIFFREPFYELRRKWAAFHEGRMIACLTTIPLVFGDGTAAGIAGVGVHPHYRGRGIASEMLQFVAQHGDEKRLLLFAKDPRLYHKVGFQILDHVISSPLPFNPNAQTSQRADFNHVHATYQAWAEAQPNRLRRTPKRWELWTWQMKSCFHLGTGYFCTDGDRVRELLPEFHPLPFPEPISWYGLESMAHLLKIPLTQPRREVLLMGLGFAEPPQMFMSDQF
jgi:GNAT superfamily N-acetyltransferase